MSKTILNIKSLTIHLHGESGHAINPLAAILMSAVGHHATSAQRGAEAQRDNTTTGQDPDSAVLAFLRSDPRYTLRTFTAIAKAFPNMDVDDVLGDLVAAGQVSVKHRRSDGAALYEAVGQASPEPAQPPLTPYPEPATTQPAPELSRETVLAFLRSDSRFTLRTAAAVGDHFSAHDEDDVEDVLEDLINDGDVIVKRRRSDGTALYQAAQRGAPMTITPQEPDVDAARVTGDAILAFLRSDPRYTMRSQDAIAKEFSGANDDELESAMTSLVNARKVLVKHRHHDSAALFQAA